MSEEEGNAKDEVNSANEVKNEDWLKEYYTKVITDKNIDLGRKDTFTNRSLVSLLGIIAIYIQCFFSNVELPVLRIGIILVALAIIIQFLSHASISYDNIRKLNFIREAIENYWMEPTKEKKQEVLNT